ncbi:hypothetical protein KL86DPRO_20624 [uncultured delta proteobacterium]|uniref:PocR domain-containing protein n=1 Tax=uncultured delta proteobacterium TaxID=34034 RepID=A0A212K3D5_9DELT|nr:hypothetical protein KL86DPRO_20624 [uncultured delta proteobacterium]
MNTPMSLLDCIDIALLQDLQDSLAASLGTTVVLADPEGAPITAPSGWDLSRQHGPAEKPGHPFHPEVSPAVVTLFAAEARIGQWLVGGALPQAAPDVRTCIFMPLTAGRKKAGFLGFDQKTFRDWPPEALAHFGILAVSLAGIIHAHAEAEEWGGSSRFEPSYQSSLHPGIAS